jgi:hypothetical protein
VFLQYLLGFRRLGWDVLLLDRLEPDMCVDAAGQQCSIDHAANLAYLRRVLRAFDLEDSFALAYNGGEQWYGIPREAVRERVKRSALLLNVMGFVTDDDILSWAPHRVFLDIDPGFGQMWRELGQANLFQGHDQYVTIAENIGQPDCTIPTCGLRWITTRQPVVLEHWPVQSNGVGGSFTSVGAWRGPYAAVEFGGRRYGLRAHEFRKFAALPMLCDQSFEIALDIHHAEASDIALLAANGWTRVDPAEAAGDPAAYQRFIRGSKAEFLVAKGMYVDTRGGWFSDRSTCYLASGKPVLAQDTGLRAHYPVGEGLLLFDTLEEAREGVTAISRDYRRHSRAARAVAEEYFDSDKVLSSLLAKLGVT